MRRLFSTRIATAAAALIALASSGCQGSGMPMAPNGPNPQSFGTNDALVRFVQGSPDLPPVDVEIDSSIVATNVVPAQVVPFNPATQLSSYVAVPSGSVLVELLNPATHAIVAIPFVFTAKTGDRWSVVAGGTHVGAAPTFTLFAANDGHYLTPPGAFAFTFHDASPNMGNTAAMFSCTGCNAGPSTFNVKLGGVVPPQTDASNDSLKISASGTSANSPVALSLVRTDFLPASFAFNYVNVDLYLVDSDTAGDSAIIFAISQNG
jgi:Domain of unknown function (DUF4397)